MNFSTAGGKEPTFYPLIEEPERNELEYISLTTHREQFGSVRIYILSEIYNSNLRSL